MRQDSQVPLLPLCHLPAVSRTAPAPTSPPPTKSAAPSAAAGRRQEGELDGHDLGNLVLVFLRLRRHGDVLLVSLVGLDVVIVRGVD